MHHAILVKFLPDNPVYLRHAKCHAGMQRKKRCNCRVLRYLRRAWQIYNVEGGEIFRDEQGKNPTGVFNEKSDDAYYTAYSWRVYLKKIEKAFELAVKGAAIENGNHQFS